MATLDDIFDKIPDNALADAQRMYGGALKTLANNPVGCGIVETAHKAVAKAISAAAGMANLTEGRNAVDVAKQMMEKFYAPILETVEENEGAWTFTFTECPYGLLEEDDGDLCHAVMNLEEELVRGLGGELLIEERIPEGAAKCKFTVRVA